VHRPWKLMVCRKEELAGLLGHVEGQYDVNPQKEIMKRSCAGKSRKLPMSEDDLVIVESTCFYKEKECKSTIKRCFAYIESSG
jgi:hypothetical protein